MGYHQLISAPIRAALTSALSLIDGFNRGVGRTTALVNSLSGGETVVCFAYGQTRELERELKMRGIKCNVVTYTSISDIMSRGRGHLSPIRLDHTVIEKMYHDAVASVDRQLSEIEAISNRQQSNGVQHKMVNRYNDVYDI